MSEAMWACGGFCLLPRRPALLRWARNWDSAATVLDGEEAIEFARRMARPDEIIELIALGEVSPEKFTGVLIETRCIEDGVRYVDRLRPMVPGSYMT